MDLTSVLAALRRSWWLVLVVGGLGVGAAVAVNVTSPVEYSASVQQFVSISDASAGSTNILSGSQFTLQRVKSYTQVATSGQVLQPVIDQLHLNATVDSLGKRVTATNPLDTVLIQITVTDRSATQSAAIANAIADRLATVVGTLESNDATSPVKLSVTQQAQVPLTPVSPRKSLNLAIGLLVGLALGACGALLREQLDTTISSVDQLEALTGSVPLGAVPFDATAKASPLVTANGSGVRAEAFRTLRTNLQFADVDHPPRRIVITSPLPAEGKTTSACNIALTLALSGARVVLLEGDLRKPRVCTYLGLDNAVGLTNVLAGQHAVGDVLVPYSRGSMWVLPSGPVPPNPSELLGSQAMAQLLDQLVAGYDYVIIDAPPLLPVTDAAVLSRGADGAVLVVRHGQTNKRDVEQALQLLAAVNARLLGTVLNFIPTPRTLLGKAQGYGYGYGYADQVDDAPATPVSPASTPATQLGPTRAQGRRAASRASTQIPSPTSSPEQNSVLGS